MEHSPWDDDAGGYDEARRQAEARAQQALADLKAHIVRVIETARDELLQLSAEQAEAIAGLEARLTRLEAHPTLQQRDAQDGSGRAQGSAGL